MEFTPLGAAMMAIKATVYIGHDFPYLGGFDLILGSSPAKLCTLYRAEVGKEAQQMTDVDL